MRVAWPVLTRRATPEDVVQLRAYLNERCASKALVTRVQQRVDKAQEAAIFGAGGGVEAVLRTVGARESAVKEAAAAKAAAQMGAAETVAAEAGATVKRLINSNSERMTRLAAIDSDGGLLSTTMILAAPGAHQTQKLELRTHRLAAIAVAPFLTAMEAAGATGTVDDLLSALEGGILFLRESIPAESECRSFGALELYRHFFVHLYGLCCPSDITQHVCSSQAWFGITAAVKEGILPYEGQLRQDLAELRTQRQQIDQLAACVQSITQLVQDYCVFFHMAVSVAEGLSTRFHLLAAALHPEDGVAYGAARFPSARHCILQCSSTGDHCVRLGRRAIDGRPIEALCPACSPEACMSDRVMPTATAGRVTTVTQVLSLVIAPASHIATFVLLSALASLPLAAALDVAVTVSEVQELYQGSSILVALVKAMWRGHLGEVLAQSQRAAEAYLTEQQEPLLPSSTMRMLTAQVRRSLCYQYASSRLVVDLRAAAAVLGLSGGAAELQRELEPLIATGRLPMRINSVDKRLTQAVPPGVTDARAVAVKALEKSRVSIAEMELALRQLAVQRGVGLPTSSDSYP